jgi:prenyltransferase beta subunit
MHPMAGFLPDMFDFSLVTQVASILNIMDDELTQGLGDYILSCQTYEGGIGGEPGSEAHGGYGLLLTSIMLRLR